MESLKFVFVGSGNVATNLACSLHNAGANVLQIVSRKIENARFLAQKTDSDFTDNIKKLNSEADFYFFSVKDDVILELLREVALKNKIVVHTSGSLSIDILSCASDNYGVFYPLQSFNKEKILAFNEIPICLEASNESTLIQIKKVAGIISSFIHEVDTRQRRILHIAAVFASNFTNYMYLTAEEIIKNEGLDFSILFPLIKQTALRIAEDSPYNLMTGPARRKDLEIIKKQMDFLTEYPEYKDVYKILTEKIMSKYK